jgi:RNA polymerase sigma-70 factor (ECF subfamily)
METTLLTTNVFEELYHKYGKRLTTLATGYVRDKDTAKDIVHDSFVALCERRGRFDVSDNLEAYLFQIVKNLCLRYRRDEYLERFVYENILRKERGVMSYYTQSIESCNPNSLFMREIVDICKVELENMPPLTREIFMASRVEGKSYREIADDLNIDRSKVDNELRKAVSKLRQSLSDYLPLLFLMLSSE